MTVPYEVMVEMGMFDEECLQPGRERLIDYHGQKILIPRMSRLGEIDSRFGGNGATSSGTATAAFDSMHDNPLYRALPVGYNLHAIYSLLRLFIEGPWPVKRDMDLCRQILLEVEANPKAIGHGFFPLDIEGREPTEVSYHIQLLDEAGLLEAKNLSTLNRFEWRAIRLTYAGHEFLDASRKDTLWQKAKTITLEKTGGLSLDVLKALLVKLATDAVLGGGS